MTPEAGPSGGPLCGYRVLEVGGIGAAPFGAMLLSDLGADVLRIDRPGADEPQGPGLGPIPVVTRGRRWLILDLKDDEERETLLTLADSADVLIEAYRPGVAERLGIGPEALLRRNPRLVYARMTGWGQTGPLAGAAGHDINYIALAGVLGRLGRTGSPPPPPLALAGDFGGGGCFLALGVLAALLEREKSGRGQVIDAAMVDGASLLLSAIWGLWSRGEWSDARQRNVVDGAAPYYDSYECSDGKFVAVGAMEDRFYEELCQRTGMGAAPERADPVSWPGTKARFAELFRTRTQREWCDLLEGTDACVTPVLGLHEVPAHPHHAARGSFVEIDGAVQPAPAPRFSRTPASVKPTSRLGRDRAAATTGWGAEPRRAQGGMQ